ncbi:tellurium resistance protein TerC [Chryseobacterium formosus]|uniref:Tellurium resistance protein TerC n=1 Tax=Chryseobacterium formosus TaxID=1537363 RepID=A0ABT3XW93_9FLAO|nr:MauE/DoxX family redox-associated membrane protein [Chryseobacterium formosus]MCX8525900.1 tellurium resistance protein TerC [Chryseobacterium formosus]
MKNTTLYLKTSAVYFFILLFCYAAVSKASDFENFQIQIGQSPLLSAYADSISYVVIFTELLIVLLLIFPRTQIAGLYSSTALMSAFTLYIYLILNYSDFVPCSCGGLLEKLGWTEHLIFNIFCVLFGIAAVFISEKYSMRSYATITFALLCSNLLSCALIVFLFLDSEYIIKKENNFTRRFLMHPLLKTHTADLAHTGFYFAGFSDGRIYLGDRNFPQNLISYDTALAKSDQMKIDLDVTKHVYRKLEIKIHKGNYYVYDGTVPILMRGTIGNPTVTTISYNDAFFTQMEVLNDYTFGIRTQSSKTKELLLGKIKIQADGKNKVELFSNLLQKQKDGVFDSDGYLSFDQSRKTLSYIYTYRNQFLIMDTLLQLQRKASTIDTIKTAQLITESLSDGRHKIKNIPMKVNGRGISYGGLLFNPSELRGRNESVKRWKNNTVVDLYNTTSNEYAGSLYIEKDHNKGMSDFIVTEKHLYAVIGNRLVRYQLTHSLTKHFNTGKPKTVPESRHNY